MRRLLSIGVLLLVATGASAQIDPDPDGVGLYFDTEATVWCRDAFGSVSLYLCLTNPSSPNGVAGYQCRVDFDPSVMYSVFQSAPNISMATGTDFVVGFRETLPSQSVVVLAEIQLQVFGPAPIVFRLDEYLGSACYADGADPRILIPMHPSSGDWSRAVAVLNGDCDVIPTTPASWGEIKSLYGAVDREVTR